MSWINDIGGMHGFGPVPVHAPSRASEPWSARMWAINQILIDRGLYNFDHYRHAIERMDPADYLASTSDVRRLVAVETLQRERRSAAVEPTSPRAPAAAGGMPARFAPGSPVAVRTDVPATHSRTPRYVRGRRGVVQALRGRSVCPEERVQEIAEAAAQQIYSVRFEAAELWGAQGLARCPVLLDLWEGWLEPIS